jgi:hypothetical protein
MDLSVRLRAVPTTERHIPPSGRDDHELLSSRSAILTGLLHCGVRCVVSSDEDGIASGADADLVSPGRDLGNLSHGRA